MEAGFEPKEFGSTAGTLHLYLLMPLSSDNSHVPVFCEDQLSQKKLHHALL